MTNHDDGTLWRIDGRTNGIMSRTPGLGAPVDLASGGPQCSQYCSGGLVVVARGGQDSGVVLNDPALDHAPVIINTPDTGYGGIAGPLGSPRVAADPSGIWVALPVGRVERVDD